MKSGVTMLYNELSVYYRRLESISRRLEMTDVLIEMLSRIEPSESEKVIALTLGRISPAYEGKELGIAEKMALKAIHTGTGIPEDEIDRIYRETGDIGKTSEILLTKKTQRSLFSEELTVERVFRNLKRIEMAQGRSSQDLRMKIIAEMMHDSEPLDARYLSRTLCGKMRLGISDMTLIDALSYYLYDGWGKAVGSLDLEGMPEWVHTLVGTLTERKTATLYELIEIFQKHSSNELDRDSSMGNLSVLEGLKSDIQSLRAEIALTYNIHPDLPLLTRMLLEGGTSALKNVRISPGVPIMSMLGERLHSLEDILNRMGGKCAFEHKYDGLRIQVHVRLENGSKKVTLYSRQLENVTSQFPDLVGYIEERIDRECIVEGECVPVDQDTGEMLPFQVISQRRGRKSDIGRMADEVPVSLVLFDCMFVDGRDLTQLSYPMRRKILEELVGKASHDKGIKAGLSTSRMEILSDVDEAKRFFEGSLEAGCEGIMAKSIGPGSIYQAGSRGFLWIKYKREYTSEMVDSFDLVIIGGFHGSGRRGGKLGAYLAAVYDPEEDRFESLCKIGSGFTDQDLESMEDALKPHFIRDGEKDPRIRMRMKPDVLIEPSIVIEVIGAEITFSPVHTCCIDKIRPGYGFALRFPRFTGRYRTDKSAEQATSSDEVMRIYSEQIKAMRT